MRDTVNKEGLTWDEWICAAGRAVFDRERLLPYSESWTETVVDHALSGGKPVKQIVAGIIGPRFKLVRKRRVDVYPRRLRAAWRGGEDPLEYR